MLSSDQVFSGLLCLGILWLGTLGVSCLIAAYALLLSTLCALWAIVLHALAQATLCVLAILLAWRVLRPAQAASFNFSWVRACADALASALWSFGRAGPAADGFNFGGGLPHDNPVDCHAYFNGSRSGAGFGAPSGGPSSMFRAAAGDQPNAGFGAPSGGRSSMFRAAAGDQPNAGFGAPSGGPSSMFRAVAAAEPLRRSARQAAQRASQ
jgi:hypothetical protein